MKNIAYAIWMVGWPVACSIDFWVFDTLHPERVTQGNDAFVTIFNIVIWIWVGWALFEGKTRASQPSLDE